MSEVFLYLQMLFRNEGVDKGGLVCFEEGTT